MMEYYRGDPGYIKQPHHMLLILALGGTNEESVEDARFSKRFEVDYVRVYKNNCKLGLNFNLTTLQG